MRLPRQLPTAHAARHDVVRGLPGRSYNTADRGSVPLDATAVGRCTRRPRVIIVGGTGDGAHADPSTSPADDSA